MCYNVRHFLKCHKSEAITNSGHYISTITILLVETTYFPYI